MKTKNIIISFVLTMVTMLSAQAQTLTIDNVSAQAGGEIELMVKADNVGSYIATGFYVELPTGFSSSNVNIVVPTYIKSDHVIKMGHISNTKLRIAIYSLANSFINLYSNPTIGGGGQSGGSSGGRSIPKKAPSEDEEDIPLTLCTLKLSVPSKSGTYTGHITGIEFSNSSHSLYMGDAKSFTITIGANSHIPGDVDGNGKVDIVDVTMTISHILGQKPAGFNKAAADVNGDGKVDIVDVTSIIDMILKAK